MANRNKQRYNDPWDRDFYETGSTCPPKDRGGIIAVLLVLVIVLGSIVTALGLMNIRLTKALSALTSQEGTQDYLIGVAEPDQSQHVWDEEEVYSDLRLGVQYQTVTEFDCQYYSLPKGCLVLSVDAGCAQEAGLQAGDVILSVGAVPVEDARELESCLAGYDAGSMLQLQVYQCTGETVTLEMIVGE